MNFFKNAVYVLLFINLVSLGFNGWMYKELHSPDIITVSDPALHTLAEESRTRDTYLQKSIFLIHHRIGIHPPAAQEMCPACEQLKKDIKSIPNDGIKVTNIKKSIEN